MSEFKEKVCKYYELVDANKFEQLFFLFSSTVLYIRCEEKIEGMDDLKDFYLNKRRIKGKHNIDDVIQSDNIVVAKGKFIGENLDLEFADFFYFDNTGKIEKRYTYLAKGYSSTV